MKPQERIACRKKQVSNDWKNDTSKFPRIGNIARGLIALALAPILTATAIDPPHYIVQNGDICGACHMAHSALGSNLSKADTIGNLCMSCHVPGGLANNKPFVAGDQAVHWMGLGTNLVSSGTSHRWDSSFAGRLNPLGGAATASAGKIVQSGVYSGAYTRAFTITITNSGAVGAARFNWSATMNGGGGTNILTAAAVTNLGDGIVLSFTDGGTNLTSFAANDRWQLIVRNDTRWPTNDPVVFVLTNGGGGMVTCAACHDEKLQTHQPFDTNAPAYGGAGTGQGRHFMRADNDRHQLCNDCHVARVVTNSSFGSHPVGIAITTGLYYKVATNLKYEPGTTNIVCMTCHQIHYASTSDGTLLRMTNDNNLCISCHTLANTSSAHFSSTSYMTLWPGGQYGSIFPAQSNAAQRGTCANCHFVHGWPNATNTAMHNPKLTVDFEENTCFTCHDANGPSGKNVKDDFAKTYHHPVDNSDPWRRPGRSVECTDCHNPHMAKVGVHDYNATATATRNDATNSPVLAGVDGVAISYTGLTNFQVVGNSRYTYIPENVGAAHEYEICFKCHSGYGHPTYTGGTASFANNSATVTGSGTAWTTNLVGMWISCTNDTRSYVITAVASATSLTLSSVYSGTTASGQGFFIRNTPPNETPYYGTGTATFTPGSTTVTGTGTAWNSGMLGSWIYASNNPAVVYMIVAVNSATSLTIAPAYK